MQPQDLNSLTEKALKDIAQARADNAVAMQRNASRRRPWATWAGLGLLGAAVLGVLDSRIWVYWVGVSESQQVAEMTATLTAANAAVDKSHGTTGEWPDRVPLPALAALVDLQNPGPDYRLVARTPHWQLTMTPSGSVQRKEP